MKPSEQAANGSSTIDRLDRIRMSPDERRIARASMLQAELIADLLMRANKDLRHVLGFIGRCIGALAHRSKVSPVAREWRLP
jgi:hypothetical protein